MMVCSQELGLYYNYWNELIFSHHFSLGSDSNFLILPSKAGHYYERQLSKPFVTLKLESFWGR